MTQQEAAAAGQPGGMDASTGNPPFDNTSRRWQTSAGAAVLAVALWMGWAAWHIPAMQGAQSTQAAWVPGLCAVALAVCGVWLMAEARSGGWRNMGAASRMAGMQITHCAWVAAGLLVNVLLIAQIGFVLASALCYVLALQGLRRAAHGGQALRLQHLLKDAAWGLGLSALVLALFTRVLGVALPVLTDSGWL